MGGGGGGGWVGRLTLGSFAYITFILVCITCQLTCITQLRNLFSIFFLLDSERSKDHVRTKR